MKTPACQALLDTSTRDTLQRAHSQGDDEFISQLYCRNFSLEFSKMKSILFRYLLICSARNSYSEVVVSSSPNRYAMASVQFILKNVRNHTHPKRSLVTTLNHVSTVSVFSMSKHTPVPPEYIHALFFLKGTTLISTQGTAQTFKEHFIFAAPTPEFYRFIHSH